MLMEGFPGIFSSRFASTREQRIARGSPPASGTLPEPGRPVPANSQVRVLCLRGLGRDRLTQATATSWKVKSPSSRQAPSGFGYDFDLLLPAPGQRPSAK